MLVDDAEAPGGWGRVLGRYKIGLWASSLNAEAIEGLRAFAESGGHAIVPAGAGASPEVQASWSLLSGVTESPQLHSVRTYRWLEASVSSDDGDASLLSEKVASEPMLALAAEIADHDDVEVLVESAPENAPLLTRRRVGRGAIYTCMLPWFKGGHGELSGIIQELGDRLITNLDGPPVSIENGLPTIAFTSSALPGKFRTVAVANNAAAAWTGTLHVAVPLGCSAPKPRCYELPTKTPCRLVGRGGRTLTVQVSIPAFDIKVLQVECMT